MWFSTLVHTDVLDVRCLQLQCSCPVTSRSSPWEGAEAEPLDGTWLSGEIALRHLNRVHLVLDGVHYLLAEQGSSFFDLGSFGFHLQQHHLSQINRVDPLWAFWFWAVGEASSVWGPRPFTCIYVYMYICIYLYIYISIYLYIYIYISIYLYIYICICVYIYMCVYMYISIYVYIYISIYLYIYISIYLYIYISIYLYMYICIYVYMYICIYVYMYMYNIYNMYIICIYV